MVEEEHEAWEMGTHARTRAAGSRARTAEEAAAHAAAVAAESARQVAAAAARAAATHVPFNPGAVSWRLKAMAGVYLRALQQLVAVGAGV
mgnify:CR=1 FL=1